MSDRDTHPLPPLPATAPPQEWNVAPAEHWTEDQVQEFQSYYEMWLMNDRVDIRDATDAPTAQLQDSLPQALLLPPRWQDLIDYRIVGFAAGGGYYDLNSLKDLLPYDDVAALMQLKRPDLDKVQRAWRKIRHTLDDRPLWRAWLDAAWAQLWDVARNERWDLIYLLLDLLPEEQVDTYWRLPVAEQARILRAWQTIRQTLQEPTPVKWWERRQEEEVTK